MRETILFTDSGSDLTKELQGKYNVKVLPLKINFNGQEFTDGVTISTAEFYKKLETATENPKTSQLNAYDFQEAFTPFKGKDVDIVVLTLSSGMSGTFNSANSAKETLKMDNIHIFDTRTVAVGQGLIAIETAKAIEKGMTIDKLVPHIENLISKMRVYGIMDTLRYLKQGGRISHVSAILGTILKIKPIFTTEKGVVTSVEKVKTFGKGVQRVFDMVLEKVDTTAPIYFTHANASEKLKEVMEKFATQLKFTMGEIIPIGCTVGTHVGPGAIGIAFLEK